MEQGDTLTHCTVLIFGSPDVIIGVLPSDKLDEVTITNNLFVCIDPMQPFRSRLRLTWETLRAIWSPLNE
jgi:hypothetical protein